MPSLYGRLFAYRERRDRRPLEDFLTEALCDLLNRLPRDVMGRFVAELLLPPAATRAWQQVVDDGGKLLWATQQAIGDYGRLDLMLAGDETPLLVVENKVGHTGTVGQLAGYGQWLLGRQVAGQTWRGVVVFLTHFTPPPDGFATGDTSTYGVPWQCVCRWPAVWRWLNANASAQPGTTWQALAKELADFLRENEMTSETMTQHDLSALEVYLPSAARVSKSFERIWNEAINPTWEKAIWGHDIGAVARSWIQYASEGALIWDWGYLRPPHSPYQRNVWHLGWGIAFPEQFLRWSGDAIPPLPKRPYAFFGLFSEDDGSPVPPDPQQQRWGLGDGWSVSALNPNGLIKGRALCDFDPDPDRLAEQIIAWVKEAGCQLQRAIPAIVRAVPAPGV